ncbi:MAG: hypothetical protein WBY94_17960 [Polyangiaceae bacterium]
MRVFTAFVGRDPRGRDDESHHVRRPRRLRFVRMSGAAFGSLALACSACETLLGIGDHDVLQGSSSDAGGDTNSRPVPAEGNVESPPDATIDGTLGAGATGGDAASDTTMIGLRTDGGAATLPSPGAPPTTGLDSAVDGAQIDGAQADASGLAPRTPDASFDVALDSAADAAREGNDASAEAASASPSIRN